MDTLEDSFQLLSSMSPKLNKHKKVKKKVTKLALKTNFRRSSIYDKAPQETAKVMNIVSSSSENTTSSDDNIKIKKETRTLRKEQSVIIIESSDDSLQDEIDNNVVPDSDIDDDFRIKSDDKKTEIVPKKCADVFKAPTTVLKWVQQLEVESNVPNFTVNVSVFSEVSTIFGENKIDLNDDLLVLPSLNSTFVPDKNCFRFDEMFQKVDEIPQKKVVKSLKKKSVDKSLEKAVGNLSIDDGLELEDSFDRVLAKPSKIPLTPQIPVTPLHEQENLLDELYGNSWRKVQEKVLPKTEEKVKKKDNTQKATKTEIKPKKSLLYKNPYLNVNNGKSSLLKTMQSARLRLNVESPWTEKLQQLCDSDSHSDTNSSIENLKPDENFKKKLNFDDSDDEDNYNINDVPKRKTTVKKNEDNRKKSSKNVTKDNDKPIQKKTNNKKPYSETKSLPDLESDCRIDDIKPDKNFTRKFNFDISDTDSDDYGIHDVPKRKTVKKNEQDARKITKTTDKPDKTVQKKRDAKEKAKERFLVSTEDSDSDSLSDIDHKWRDPRAEHTKSRKNRKPLSFLASLAGTVPLSNCDPAARMYREGYKQRKEELAKRLYAMYNKNVFENKLPDDMPIEWSDRMLSTAGLCYMRTTTRRTGAIERSARIQLATKVLDSADRLRNTLIHEMCHAAAWIVDEIKDGHGPYWQAWTRKAMKVYPELPPIRTRHDYAIQTKYTYRCVDCGYSFGRHSKSVNIAQKCCGWCKGKFEVLINKQTKDGVKSVVAGQKAPTAFANFVKENYKSLKTDNLKHGDVMKILSKRFKELKVVNG